MILYSLVNIGAGNKITWTNVDKWPVESNIQNGAS